MRKIYSLQKHSFIVNLQSDKKNKYNTLAYDSKNSRTLSVNQDAYFILSFLFEKKASTFDEIKQSLQESGFGLNEAILHKFLGKLIQNNIIYAQKT